MAYMTITKYDDGIIRIDCLAEFLPDNQTWKHPVSKQRSRKWHIGRIIYFINHPEEIRDIGIDNVCDLFGNILPQPVIQMAGIDMQQQDGYIKTIVIQNLLFVWWQNRYT